MTPPGFGEVEPADSLRVLHLSTAPIGPLPLLSCCCVCSCPSPCASIRGTECTGLASCSSRNRAAPSLVVCALSLPVGGGAHLLRFAHSLRPCTAHTVDERVGRRCATLSSVCCSEVSGIVCLYSSSLIVRSNFSIMLAMACTLSEPRRRATFCASDSSHPFTSRSIISAMSALSPSCSMCRSRT